MATKITPEPRSEAQPLSQAAPGAKPGISLCMMVKNEEKRLPTCLQSAAPWVDEIIVVDTGSTDRTVAIAEEFGAKVYHHPWEHSFSKHRNQSISYATGDWILILDADEKLDQETAGRMRNLLSAPPRIAGFLFELYNDTSTGGETFLLHPRFFRNNNGFHYSGKVHNRPVVAGEMARCDIRLIHYGYNEDPQTMAVKHQRRIDMIRKWVEEEPENFQAHSYLAHTLQSQPETQTEAVDVALEALRLLRKNKTAPAQEYPHVYYPLLNSLTALRRDEEMLQRAQECMALVPYYPDPEYFMAWVYYRQRQWEQVCTHAALFLRLQDECHEHPDRFIFFENLTYDMLNQVLFRWAVSAAHLGRFEESIKVFRRMTKEREALEGCRTTVQNCLILGFYDLAERLCQEAVQAEPQWTWPEELARMAGEKSKENKAVQLKDRAKEALDQQRVDQAAELLRQAVELTPLDPELLFQLAKALEGEGKADEAEAWLMRGLNAHPGHPWAWKKLAESCFGRGEYAEALVCYRAYLAQVQGDQAVEGRVAACQRRLTVTGPTVAQAPPKLVVFLISGLTPEMVRQPAPRLLMGKAWGELMGPAQGSLASAPQWATLFTGMEPHAHGVTQETDRQRPLGLQDLRVLSLWESLPPGTRLGLLAMPLGCPVPRVQGWAVAGYPAGLLGPDLVHPPSMAPRFLAAGYRTDYLLSGFDESVLAQRLESDILQESVLYQVERSKLSAAMAMPAVDVLVIGLTVLDRIQRTHDLAHYTTFAAYQQVYGWIEATLAALQPANFAILSERGYAQKGRQPQGGGFYCLSWLKGENGQAGYTDVAPEIMKLMGADPSSLGRPRAL